MFHQNPYQNHQNPNFVHNPHIPYNVQIPGGLTNGKTVHIGGHVPHHANRFEINFKSHSGTALVINPRFDQNSMVRNTCIHGNWGGEELDGGNRLQKGQNFQMDIRAEHGHYSVSINGHHAFNYNHRLPMHEVNTFEITGDVQVHQISWSGDHGGQNNFQVPGVVSIRNGCQPGRMIQIQGQVPHGANRFNVYLQGSDGNEPNNIPLVLSVRWDDPSSGQVIVLNNRQHGNWGNEERGGNFPFHHGQSFELLFLCEHNEWKIAVNGQHLTSFRHRNQMHETNHVSITGSVEVRSVNIF